MTSLFVRSVFALMAVVLIIAGGHVWYFSKTTITIAHLDRLSVTASLSPLPFLTPKNLRFMCTKWIVVTSVNEPTDQIAVLSRISGYQLVVVADRKTSKSWSFANVIFLSVDDQRTLGYSLLDVTPLNSYTRKNIGYLFAIAHGARFIYDTDDDNAPIVDINSHFGYAASEHGLIYHDTTDCDEHAQQQQQQKEKSSFSLRANVPNPYAHFGQPQIWPRGYPLSRIRDNYNNSYVVGVRPTSLVQQGVVNGDPDVDAVFRLTKSMKHRRLNVTFDASAPSVQLPVHTMAPFNSQNTLFHAGAFWALYLPKTVSFRLTDIWRSYWSQRLMWLLDATVTFTRPTAFQRRSAHSYMDDYKQEQDMYVKTEELVDFLFDWQCAHERFYACVLELSRAMAARDFWQQADVDAVERWLADLTDIGYSEPEIVNHEHNLDGLVSFRQHVLAQCNRRPYEIEAHTNLAANCMHSFVRYTPSYQTSIDAQNYCCEGRSQAVYDRVDTLNYLHQFCKAANSMLPFDVAAVARQATVNDYYAAFDLVITFNENVFDENVIMLRHLFGMRFRNVIFCGKDIVNAGASTYARQQWKRFDAFTFIKYNTKNGHFHYHCMAKAIEMGFAVNKGFLLLSDDVLFKYWNVTQTLDTDNIMFAVPLRLESDLKINATSWFHWNKPYALGNLIRLFSHLNTSRAKNDAEMRFLSSIHSHKVNKSSPVQSLYYPSDYFYVPRRKFEQFHFVSRMFTDFDVYLEVAVPTILAGIDDDHNATVIQGTYNWNYTNNRILHFKSMYKSIGDLYHPFKLSECNDLKRRYDYCKYYLSEMLEHFNR